MHHRPPNTIKGRWTQKDELLCLIKHAMHKRGRPLRFILQETKHWRKKKTTGELRRILREIEA